MRRRFVVTAIVAVATALAAGGTTPAHAQAPSQPLLGVNVDDSVVDLSMLAPYQSQVVFSEVLPSGERVPLGHDVAKNPHGGPDGAAELRRAVTWRCDRLERRFVGTATTPVGTVVEATGEVRTPSCRDRLLVTTPRRVDRHGTMKTTVRDRWGLGGLEIHLCVRRRGDRKRCRTFEMKPGEATITSKRRVSRKKGLIDVDASIEGRYHARSVAGVGRTAPRKNLPTLLITGDSMIQGVDSFIADALRSRYDVVSDTRPGTGVSKPGDTSWRSIARSQAKRHEPTLTMVFLGANDRFAMERPGGGRAECCGAEWVAEYVRRIGSMAKSWARNGKGRILWATLPPPRDPRLTAAFGAVNAAIAVLARREADIELVRLDRRFSVDGAYVEVLDGVDVRDRDGIHLSVAGERIAAKAFTDAERGVGRAGDD